MKCQMVISRKEWSFWSEPEGSLRKAIFSTCALARFGCLMVESLVWPNISIKRTCLRHAAYVRR